MDSPSALSGSSPSSVPSAMQGGGTLARTLAVGWHIAFRLWPVAVIVAAPEVIASLLKDDSPAWTPTWQRLSGGAVAILVHAVIAAFLLPSVMRWFADHHELTSFRRRDAHGRIRPALAAALVAVLLTVLIDLVFLQPFSQTTSHGAWMIVALLASFWFVVWIKLRLFLMVQVAVIERCGAVTAARRSWELTRGRVLTIIGVGAVLALAWFVPVIASMNGRDVSGAVPHRFTWSAAVMQVVMMPWFFAFAAVLYHDARFEHDDVDSRRIAQDATSS